MGKVPFRNHGGAMTPACPDEKVPIPTKCKTCYFHGVDFEKDDFCKKIWDQNEKTLPNDTVFNLEKRSKSCDENVNLEQTQLVVNSLAGFVWLNASSVDDVGFLLVRPEDEDTTSSGKLWRSSRSHRKRRHRPAPIRLKNMGLRPRERRPF